MGGKSLTLGVTESLFNRIQDAANIHGCTVEELLRKYMLLGLVVSDIEQDLDRELIVRDKGEDMTLVLFK